MTRWLIDTSNVVGARPDGWWRDREAAVVRLVDEVTRWRAEAGDPVTLVCDGYPGARVRDGDDYGVAVVFAHSTAPDAADDEIVRLVEAHDDPSTLCVVTSDRALVDRVTELGASTEGAGRFRERLADIEARRADRAILSQLGVDEASLLGRGGEARVFALDDNRVVRLPHPGASAAAIEERVRIQDAVWTPEGLPTPRALERLEIDGRLVVIEERLAGRNGIDLLAGLQPGSDERRALIRAHLDAADAVADLPLPTDGFGEVFDWGFRAGSFSEWSTTRLGSCLDAAPDAVAQACDPRRLTEELVGALPGGEPTEAVLVHLDAFLGNMLADGPRITAVLDFGPMTVGGPRHLDPLVAIAYLAAEITPPVTDDDRAVALSWADERGLADAVEPAERWVAAYWSPAVDDEALHRWCRRILLGATR